MPPQVKKIAPPAQPVSPQANGIWARVTPITENKKPDIINFYGISGTGKTTLACQWPKPLLLIGAEDGTKSVATMPGVDFIRLQASEEIGELFEGVRQGRNARTISKPYATVVVDTVTSYQALTLKEVLGLDRIPHSKTWGMATMDQYGQSAIMTKTMIQEAVDLAETYKLCHVILLTQEGSNKEDNKSELVRPKIMAELSKSVRAFFNPVCDYLLQTFQLQRVKESKTTHEDGTETTFTEPTNLVDFCLRTRPHPDYNTKFRCKEGMVLPEYVAGTSKSIYEQFRKLQG